MPRDDRFRHSAISAPQALRGFTPLSNKRTTPFVISVNTTSLTYGQTVTGTKVSGPPGTITWQWELVSGSANVVAASPNSAATSFYAGDYGNFSAVYRLKGTLSGLIAYSANVNAIAYAEAPLPPLSVTGGGSGGIFPARAGDGYWSISTGFSVSGGSGDYSMVNSKGETGTTSFFIEGYIDGPSGGWQDITVALHVTDNVTGEQALCSVQYQYVKP